MAWTDTDERWPLSIEGIDANLEQVRSGMAWCYTRYLSQVSVDIQASYKQAEADARAQRRGLWSDTQEPVPPWQFRHAGQ